MVQETLEAFGRIDILVNNAAIAYYNTILETSIEEWDLIMSINLRGPFLCIKAALPTMMEQRGGSIINISSTRAQEVFSRIKRPGSPKAISSHSPYGASKAALERLSTKYRLS